MKGRWSHDTYILGDSVVGVIEEDAFGRGWWAYGCEDDWQDTNLGLHESKRQAKQRVEGWVNSHG